MSNFTHRFLFLLCLCFSIPAFVTGTIVVKNTKANAVIITEGNHEIELLAAREFNDFVLKITGTELPIVSVDQYRRSAMKHHAIVFGTRKSNILIRNYTTEKDFDGFTFESLLVRSVKEGKQHLVLVAGSEPKGVLNGSYILMEELLKRITDKTYVDVDYTLGYTVADMAIPDIDIVRTPYCTVNGLELEGMGLGNGTMLDMELRAYEYRQWCSLVDWAKRHKMNFISNWPYSGESSMNNFPDIVILKNYKKISKFSEKEIMEAVAHRREFFRYACENGVDPYIMIYVPGWINAYTAESYPEYVGNNFQEFVVRSGGRPFNWGNPDVHRFMADLSAEVIRTYPEIKGIHFRVWGSESAPDAENKNRSTELIRDMIRQMVNAVYEIRPDIKILLSGYSNFKDNSFEYVRTLPGQLILQMKWDEDWAVSNDPKVPAPWLGIKDHILRAVSHSIPNEEAIPFWFPSAKLYEEGLRKYLKPGEATLSGFPVNFREWHMGVCDNDLNLSAIARLNWDPFSFDSDRFYMDNYALLFGEKAAIKITEASRLTAEVMAGFLTDYAGIIEGMWPGNYFCLKALIGKGNDTKWYKAIQHITSKADRPEYLLDCRAKLADFVDKQGETVRLLGEADGTVKTNREYFGNMLHVYSAWYYLLVSRIDAIDIVLNNFPQRTRIVLDRFQQTEEEFKYHIRQLTNFSQKAVGDYHTAIRKDFLQRIQAEQEYMEELYAPEK